jgi:threonylcarbamoyladenosine tRNA methylthiotransferase MtaB
MPLGSSLDRDPSIAAPAGGLPVHPSDRSDRPDRSIFAAAVWGYDLTMEPLPTRVRRATIANLGCKVNQSEMDAVARLLRDGGVDLVDDGTADLVVVNTCTVTSMADRKSRQLVRRARRANPGAQVFVTGCSVVVDPDSIGTADPAARLFDNDSKPVLLAEIEKLLDLPEGGPMPTLSGVRAAGPVGPAPAVPMPAWAEESGEELEAADEGAADAELAADRTRAFVKIQDGCSFHCTYCIIPRARGPEWSVPADQVLASVRGAVAAGHREVVLTGINAGTYRSGTLDLSGLVRRILGDTPIERIRLSSVEPQHVTDDLLAVWAGSGGRCLPHFHVPLQSGDDSILRRMGRRYTTTEYADVVARIRVAVPDVAIHADLIAGFPGEDEESWSWTVAFVRGLSLAGVHVFRYSGRPGTPAVRMVGQVDGRTKKRRASEALALAAEARATFARAQLGRELRVLFERPRSGGRPGEEIWLGRADNYVPVAVRSGESLANRIGLVRATTIDPAVEDRVVGEAVALF